ncbi:MAG: FAD-binding oxidoreductase [Bacteroidetes bacterium]|nr:MAG: FAD-binding oxidoreductase [Bacteroidota bacterium]
MYDFLIVGHGIAGSLLGWQLENAGRSCYYIDAPQQVAATEVAAGIINPITGRRFVKSWRIDHLVPLARDTYRELEAALGIRIYYELPLVRTLFTAGDQNNWHARYLDPEYRAYLAEEAELGEITAITKPALGYGEVLQTARVDIGKLQRSLRARRLSQGCLSEQHFHHQALDIYSDYVQYAGIPARQVIFCEGWRSRFNPFFNSLPFKGNKGEILHIRTQAPLLKRMFKHKVFLIPLPDDTYWIGSTSDNHFTHEEPESTRAAQLENDLRQVLQLPFQIIDHQAAVRPTIRDRRPLVGRHPHYPHLWILNGLGTKGASLAPLAVQQLVAHILDGAPLLDEINIDRFSSYWSK